MATTKVRVKGRVRVRARTRVRVNVRDRVKRGMRLGARVERQSKRGGGDFGVGTTADTGDILAVVWQL